MVALRDCVHELIDLQMDAYTPDSVITEKQGELNRLYDSFSAKNGLINDRANRLAFSADSSYYLLCSLEIVDDDGKLERKADMFTKRTIKQHTAVSTVDTPSEALAVSIGEKARVDLPYMSELCGKSEDEIISELSGVIFKDPAFGSDPLSGWQTADEYLSGNVRKKLREARRAADHDPAYQVNVAALEKAQPKDLDASEIEVRLGATWIDPDYYRQFMYELLDTPRYLRGNIDVKYSAFTAEWQITGKTQVGRNDVAAYTTYGTDRANAYRILEDSLNLRDIRIYDTVTDPDGKERRVLKSRETTFAQQKQQAIREAFQDWVWKDPQRRQDLVKRYNEIFNSTRPREYDGSHIRFSGMNPEITLREHQKNAVAHILYGGNTLLAHEVGAGKTFEMVAACMESKRLGLSHKALFAVPNHLTEQWASEFLRLYPSANILVTTKKDFETHRRKKFCARIATGDYDAVIIGHSQFERIPISRERQERLIQEQIWEITSGIEEVQNSGGERFTVKQLERTKKGLEARLEKLRADSRKDDVVTFEQMGCDRMFVDESDNYKNLFLYTKMRNVAGLSTTDAQKSSDMFAKCRYLDEVTGNRGTVFATGTPISNSMTEMYTIQRYLQYDRLQETGMTHFDCWASCFGETVTALELAPEGTGYRARTRFAKFFNLPELMAMFKEVADIKTADQLHLPTPEVEYHTYASKPTEIQQEMVRSLSERASKVHSGEVEPTVDNMLKITSDGRKLGLDQRIINPMLPDEESTKVNQCVDNVLQFWRDGEAEKLTQLVFCDISTPQPTPSVKAAKAVSSNLDNPELHGLETAIPLDAPEPPFTIYADIRRKLIEKGIPAEQIAFIHEANTDVRKKELFGKVRSGQVRVLLGSTAKMGAGTNVQDRLVALHDLDCPWRPRDLTQRKGRIERQGNQNEKVHVCRYVTEGTFDAYLWQTVENKQKFISQIMSSKSPVRSCEDVDETALSFAEIKALCAGDPRIKERMDLDVEVSRLKIMKADHQSKQFRMEDNLLKYYPEQIEANKGFVKGLQADMETLAAHPHPTDGFAGMEIRGDVLTDKENAGAALLDACKEVKGSDPVQIGTYRGFTMSVSFNAFEKPMSLLCVGR
ncbi:MAG: SNF2-related protein [Oscillospiraceae bacterium]|jgi:N12 class adenine-specific DNA methylase|nr:SNF2-related protein [Oscillospiraceae bacterium]